MKKITFLLLTFFGFSLGFSQTELLNLSFDAAGSESIWTPIADAAAKPAEVTIAFNASGNGTGATELTGVNADGVGGRAYIFRYDNAAFDFGTSDQVSISMDLKIDNALQGTNLVLETQVSKVGGGVVVATHNNLENSIGVGAGWVTLTFDMTPNPAEFNNAGTELYFFFNMAAGAFIDAGGTIFVDNVIVTGSETAPPTCTDGIQNGDETGVDCGGPDCPACPPPFSLSIDFETATGITAFNGGTVTEEAPVVPQTTGNSSGTLAKLVRDGGEVWAGAQIDITEKLDFSEEQYIKFQVWTTAPIGTKITFKLEDKGSAGGITTGDIDQFTTVTSAWETVVYTLTSPADDGKFDRLVLLPDLDNLGDGTSDSTFYFDNIIQSNNTDDITLGTNDFDLTSFSVYPNPSKDSWTIKNANNAITSIQVFDVLGKRVLSLSPNSLETQVDGSSLKSGLYFAQVKTATGLSSLKLIKK